MGSTERNRHLPETLDVKTVPIKVVDWLTYAWQRKKKLMGLAGFLAAKYGLPAQPHHVIAEFHLLEAGNDTKCRVKVESDEMDPDELATIIKHGDVSIYDLRLFMSDACAKGFIEAGDWLVSVSW